jgi:mycofactocin precursor
MIDPTHQSVSELPTSTPDPDPETSPGDSALVEADLLVEDVSIDGMCGVY